MTTTDWTQAMLPLLILASQLEDQGQYNLAKLARATADSLARRAAYRARPAGDVDLRAALDRTIEDLSGWDIGEETLHAFRRGAAALAEGRLSLISETPNPYVCRTCGGIVLGEPVESCPTCGAWPTTFQWFPPVYWLEALDPPAALDQLRRTPLEVAVLLEGLSEVDMTRQPPTGGWAIRNAIAHLRDAQDVLDFRLDLFQTHENPMLESKAVFEWATDEGQRPPATREILASYEATRHRIVARLESLPLADWWRTGQHEEFGVVSLRQQVSYFTAHEITHLPQIAALRDWVLATTGDHTSTT